MLKYKNKIYDENYTEKLEEKYPDSIYAGVNCYFGGKKCFEVDEKELNMYKIRSEIRKTQKQSI